MSIGLVAQNSRLWGLMIVPISIHRPIQRRNSPYRIGFSPWGRFWLVWGRIVVLMNDEKNNPLNKLRFNGLDNDDVQKVSSGLALHWIVAFHSQMPLWVHKPMMSLVVPGESSVDGRFSAGCHHQSWGQLPSHQ